MKCQDLFTLKSEKIIIVKKKKKNVAIEIASRKVKYSN